MYISILEYTNASSFYTSASRYFLEEEAVDDQGKLLREKQKAVNKIGHGEQSQLHRIEQAAYEAPTATSAS
jgi:hypothetical protein